MGNSPQKLLLKMTQNSPFFHVFWSLRCPVVCPSASRRIRTEKHRDRDVETETQRQARRDRDVEIELETRGHRDSIEETEK